ncbi:MAG: RluA family pseudouridine synthase [Marinilabiliaceae bacterium]|nr:RluA family pseudouridine synthase [Marinilabiliaceae bacterium]
MKQKLRTSTVKNDTQLLDWLIEFLSNKSRSTIKSILKNGQVKVGGRVTTAFNLPLHVGDKVEIDMERRTSKTPYKGIDIVYEDEHIIVINKASGINTIAVPNAPDIPNAYHIVDQYVKIDGGKYSRIFIVHRLDRDTSGLLMFAKTARAQDILRHNWDEMVLDRRYVAVAEGVIEPSAGVIKSYLMENPKTLKVYSTRNPNGKWAVTHYRTIKSANNLTLVELNLETGRKNQIRVHLSDIQHPIIGDYKYGAHINPIGRMALHAFMLKFTHPITNEIIDLQTPIPPQFNQIVR